MKRKQLYAIIKHPDGTIVRHPVKFTHDHSRLYDGWIRNIETGLYLKKKNSYKESKAQEETES